MISKSSPRFFDKRILMLLSLLVVGCATYKEQQAASVTQKPDEKVVYTVFAAGGLGNGPHSPSDPVFKALGDELRAAGEQSMLLFTGDNITAAENNWNTDKQLLDAHIALTDNFKGKTVVIPGNNEWKAYNSNRVEKIEDYIKDLDNEGISFFPENACPIEHEVINDDLDLILIDSKWFVSNWSRVIDINKKCTDIVTRRRFLEELEGYINDGQGKNIIIAMHHPVFSNGVYAGNQTLAQHMKPLPIIGSLKEAVMDLGAFNPDHLNSMRYNYLRILVSALAQASDRITFISGHEESLQYLVGGKTHQIISGSLGSKSATDLSKDKITTIGGDLTFEGKYTYGARGFAKIQYYYDGSSKVSFISEPDLDGSGYLDVLPPHERGKEFDDFEKTNQKTFKEAVFSNPEEYDKSGFYRFLWGDRYRKYFGVPVTAPTVYLDTLYGGLTVAKEGGGHQSYSLRLEDENGAEYAMRSLRKSALKFLKFKLPGIAFNEKDYENSLPEELISDFFTTAHPYMQLVINPLAKEVGVNHSDNELFYVPKQERLGEYNDDFGDELYFIERRPNDEQENYKGYRRTIDESGKITDFESTTDMLEKIKSDESYTIDQRNFIRARVFDMLIGDWDRHQDQWRWIEYEGTDGEKEFMPVPRDRDNVLPRFDGFAMKLGKLFVPPARRFQTFDEEIDDVKWLNMGGNKLDRALLNQYDIEIWKEEAEHIQRELTEEDIDRAFTRLPLEVQDETSEFIKNSLVQRLKTLPQVAVEYGQYLNQIVAIAGTEKDDKFEVERLPGGRTKVVVKRLFSDKENEVIYERIFDEVDTRQIWIYGLGDDDEFEVHGEVNSKIKVKLVGGYGDDEFNITNKNRLKVFEWEHEDTEFTAELPRKQISDMYGTNSYHWRYFKPNSNVLAPSFGFRVDDGFFLGLRDTYIKNGLNGNPFKQKHTLGANYYFAFQAFELDYQGIFGNIFPKWNFELEGYYTSNRYVKNFFGFGNESINDEDNLDIDFYRARTEQIKASAAIAYYSLRFKALYESFQVEENDDRFFTPDNVNPLAFERQHYLGGEVSAAYDRDNASDFPTKAIYIGLTAGYKFNPSLKDNKFGYTKFGLGFKHQLIPSGDLVFATMAEYMTNIGNNTYFFYHAPSLGGDNGLRGFRDERFTGDSYFYQSSDLKLRLKEYVTAISPVTVGIFGGFDYGRVWVDGNDSSVWHTSQGGGFWINSLNALSLSFGYFNSDERNMVQVGFGLTF